MTTLIVYSLNREGDRVIYPSIDKMLLIIDSKYKLVHVAAKRARQIDEDKYYQLKKYKSKKSIGKALEEVAENLIILK